MKHSIMCLPDGEEIDPSRIKSIGTMKSVRSKDFKSLGYWYFLIVFTDGSSKEIQEGYFYSNWSKAKKKLQMMRDELIQLFNKFKSV